jgi:hypothetical protein
VEKLSDLIVDDDLAPDYATAVIDYMKRVEKHHRQDALLQETNLGRKLADFLGTINPELRHQIMSSALTNEEVSPDLLKCLINLDSFEHSSTPCDESTATAPSCRRRSSALCR